MQNNEPEGSLAIGSQDSENRIIRSELFKLESLIGKKGQVGNKNSHM